MVVKPICPVNVLVGLPASESFSSENHEVEEIADDAEETHNRYSVSVDDITYDVIASFRITDAAVCSAALSRFGYLHKR